MRSTQITESIDAGRLKLSPMELLYHYRWPLWVLVAVVVFLVLRVLSVPDFPATAADLLLMIAAAVLTAAAIGMWVELARSLRLTAVTTPLPWLTAKKLLLGMAERNRWDVRNNQKTYLRFTTRNSYVMNWRGEEICVFYRKKRIWVVSRCDPEHSFSIFSILSNRRNVRLLCRELSGNRRPVKASGS